MADATRDPFALLKFFASRILQNHLAEGAGGR
jgi:hypothetical protein